MYGESAELAPRTPQRQDAAGAHVFATRRDKFRIIKIFIIFLKNSHRPVFTGFSVSPLFSGTPPRF